MNKTEILKVTSAELISRRRAISERGSRVVIVEILFNSPPTFAVTPLMLKDAIIDTLNLYKSGVALTWEKYKDIWVVYVNRRDIAVDDMFYRRLLQIKLTPVGIPEKPVVEYKSPTPDPIVEEKVQEVVGKMWETTAIPLTEAEAFEKCQKCGIRGVRLYRAERREGDSVRFFPDNSSQRVFCVTCNTQLTATRKSTRGPQILARLFPIGGKT